MKKRARQLRVAQQRAALLLQRRALAQVLVRKALARKRAQLQKIVQVAPLGRKLTSDAPPHVPDVVKLGVSIAADAADDVLPGSGLVVSVVGSAVASVLSDSSSASSKAFDSLAPDVQSSVLQTTRSASSSSVQAGNAALTDVITSGVLGGDGSKTLADGTQVHAVLIKGKRTWVTEDGTPYVPDGG